MNRVLHYFFCAAFLIYLGLVFSAPASAQLEGELRTFNVANGDWSEDDNWDPSGIPEPGDGAVVGNDRVAVINSDVGNLELFAVGSTVGDTGTLNIEDGALLELRRGYVGGAGGALGGTAGPTTGIINMSGGELLFRGSDPVIFLGTVTGHDGFLNMTGGRLETGNFWLGRGGNATVNQSGGTVIINGGLVMSEACDVCGVSEEGESVGTYNLSGGKLDVGNLNVGWLGEPSVAMLNITGGIATAIGRLVFPTETPETGRVNLSKVGVLRFVNAVSLDGELDGDLAVELGWVRGQNLQVDEDNEGFVVIRNPGDPDANGKAEASDIDALSDVVNADSNDLSFDLTDDDLVNQDDRTEWVTNVATTFFGDTDLNGAVEFGDFITLSNNFGAAGGWAEGDNDGNGMIEFGDFIALSNNFGQTSGGVAAVPEPSVPMLIAFAVLGFGWSRRRRSTKR